MILGILFALFFVLNPTQSSPDIRDRAAVVTNGFECAEMSSQILRDGGSAADAAITALLCEGVTCPHIAGIGGGFAMTMFSAKTGKVETLNAREMAPGKASKDMFGKGAVVAGGRVIAVPSAVKGFWELHQKYGKLEWSRLFKPVIELCRRGHVVSPYLAKNIQWQREQLLSFPSMAEVIIDSTTNDVYKEGAYMKRFKLADTLEEISELGAATLYENGTLGQRLIEDIAKEGGIMTVEDLMAYKVRWDTPVAQRIQNKTLYSYSLPGSGSMVVFIMNVLNNYLPDGPVLQSFQRIVETCKYAYAMRSRLGDTAEGEEVVKNLTSLDFATEIRNKLEDDRTHNDYKYYGGEFESGTDHGTVNINILAPNGDAISATTSLNNLFGSRIHSNQTGIILNDSMDDFAIPEHSNIFDLPPSPANYIAPYKRPLTSMCPSILLDEHGDVELLVGSAGGSKITSAVAYMLLRYLYFNESVRDAVRAPKIHHQLLPMRVIYEEGLADEIITGLGAMGHEMVKANFEIGFAAITAIGREGNKLVPVYDARRLGSASVF